MVALGAAEAPAPKADPAEHHVNGVLVAGRTRQRNTLEREKRCHRLIDRQAAFRRNVGDIWGRDIRAWEFFQELGIFPGRAAWLAGSSQGHAYSAYSGKFLTKAWVSVFALWTSSLGALGATARGWTRCRHSP